MTKLMSDKQREFLLKPLKRINLLYGSVRSGKTWISLLKWALWIAGQPQEQEFLMVGKTLTTLKRNCFSVLYELVGDNFSYSLSQKKAEIFNHTVWLEGANDDRAESKIRGMTLKGIYVDELTQIPEDFYRMALSRISLPGAALLATTNPDSPDHYVNTDIILNPVIDKQVFKFLLDDNIFLGEDYKVNLKKEYTGVFYSRFILGEFIRAEGLIFTDFANDPAPHMIDSKDLFTTDGRGNVKPLKYRWCEVGFDLGGNGSAYALTATAQALDGTYYVLRSEKTQAADLDMVDIENLVKSFCGKVEQEFNVNISVINCDHIAVIVNSLNDNTDYRAELTYKPPLEDRPFVISKLLATGKIKFVKGNCEDLIDELSNLVFDEKADRPIPLDDGTMQIDTWDSLIYSMSNNWNYFEV